MHTIDCDNDAVQLLRNEKRLSLQQREYEIIQKQRELNQQLQKLYQEQNQLESESKDEPMSNSHMGLEYEIPSYCANCLGEVLDSPAKSSLSSEYSRKNSEGIDSLGQTGETQMPQLSDHSRLEAIKFQILLKLGLKNKPNVTSILPRQFIFDTLRRSGDPTINPNDYMMTFPLTEELETRDLVLDQLQQLKERNDSNAENLLQTDELKETLDQEFDEFYGRTREIITFADKGECIEQTL